MLRQIKSSVTTSSCFYQVSLYLCIPRRAGRAITLRYNSHFIICVCAKSLRCAWLFESPWSVACQASLCSWDSPGKNTGVSCLFPSAGNLWDSGIELASHYASFIGRWVFYCWATWEAPNLPWLPICPTEQSLQSLEHHLGLYMIWYQFEDCTSLAFCPFTLPDSSASFLQTHSVLLHIQALFKKKKKKKKHVFGKSFPHQLCLSGS